MMNQGNEISVLHVDDEPDVADLTAEFLDREDERISVQTATSADAGLNYLAESEIDCIVSDYQMPGMNGIEFLETFREEHPNMPFILYTGKGSEKVASQAISSGVTDYLQKETGTDDYALLANRIVNGVESRRHEQRMEFLETLENELTELAIHFLRIEERDIDALIEEGLERFGRLVEADRSYVFEIDHEAETLSNTHEWCAEGVEPQIDILQDLPLDTFPWWMQKLEKFENIRIPNVSELPPEADTLQEILQEQNIASLIVTPMISNGELVGFIGFDWVREQEGWSEEFIDILRMAGELITTARRREGRRRELERHEAYLEQAQDSITVVDENGTVQFQSDSVEETTGYRPAEILVESGFEFVHPEDRQKVTELFTSILGNSGETATAELRVETKDGSWRWVEARGVNKLDDPAINGIVTSSRDITEQKERERKLQRERDRLDQFASVVSHDLRNPLNVATGRLVLAMEECESDHLESVAEALDRMETLIEEVLILARAGKTVGEREPVELAELGQRCWHNVETESAELLIDTQAVIRADSSRLQQLVENLFKNAVEHGGDEVMVTVRTLDDGFYIEDDGPGIPEAERDEVFEAGYSSRDEGTGFGLSIVKEIVEAHDWEIRVTEGTDGGARFDITGVEFIAE